MKSWKQIGQYLSDFRIALEAGEACQTLQRLKTLLNSIDTKDPGNAFSSSAILRMMSEAATSLGNKEEADDYLNRALELLRWSIKVPPVEQVVIFLGLAENLVAAGRKEEAMQFAETAMECLADNLDEFVAGDLQQFLRRYANLAVVAEQPLLAQTATTWALLVIHAECGVQSEVAEQLLDLAYTKHNESSQNAIFRIGEFLKHVR